MLSVFNIVTVCKKAAVNATAASSLFSYLTKYIFTTCTYGMFKQKLDIKPEMALI